MHVRPEKTVFSNMPAPTWTPCSVRMASIALVMSSTVLDDPGGSDRNTSSRDSSCTVGQTKIAGAIQRNEVLPQSHGTGRYVGSMGISMFWVGFAITHTPE